MAGTERDELEAAIAARRELGEEFEPQVVDAFLARIEKRIDARVDEQVAKRARRHGAARTGPVIDWSSFALAISSLGIAIPIMEKTEIVGQFFAWIAIVLVNLFYNLFRTR
jgi:hypothetical protein